MPNCYIIAGPNGVGKTTFAKEFLPRVAACRHFINADLIAAGLSPFDPDSERIRAGRLFLRAIETAIERRAEFGMETTLSGRSQIRLVRRLRADGWKIELIYLALPSVEMAKLRVAERVAHGGHDIPAPDIARRFFRSLRHLFGTIGSEVTRTRCFMNIGENPVLVFEQSGNEVTVLDRKQFELLKSLREK